MAYNPTTDFLALWREIAGTVSKTVMPGLDFVVAALGRAGILNIAVSGTAPVANQPTTAWFLTAVPSDSAEGALFLWDPVAGAYAAATPRLFINFLHASSTQNDVSWWTSLGGPPLNTVGKDGDFAICLDGLGGIYGPKIAGDWPNDPLPGSSNIIDQAAMDATFGTVTGSLIVRKPTDWVPLLPGAEDEFLTINGGVPDYVALSLMLDSVFSSTRGSVLYRGAAAWAALGPGTALNVFTTNGPAADPTWTPKSTEFASGTRMVFHQAAAPTGWTKDVSIDDMALRVVSGAGNVTHAGSPFSTVFNQMQVGDTGLDITQIPTHSHSYVNGTTVSGASTGPISLAAIYPSGLAATDPQGDGKSHTHTINLKPAYTDVIIAQKD